VFLQQGAGFVVPFAISAPEAAQSWGNVVFLKTILCVAAGMAKEVRCAFNVTSAMPLRRVGLF